MNDEEWNGLVADLRATDSVERAVMAADKLHKTAALEDVPRLMRLLKDDDFFVREAAAWRLSELAGAAVLPELLEALQRGFDEGHDNDGFQAALADLAAADRAHAREVLGRLLESSDKATQKNAAWLLQFCEA
jgi:HEAT repeat protein